MLDDIRLILARLRARDEEELDAYGFDRETAALGFASPAVLARIFAHGDRPTAIVTFHSLTPMSLVVSMMATDDWRRVARAVVRWGVREARPFLLAQGYERAECRTMEGHADAIALLERLGFVLECRLPRFGAHGVPFLQYAWRLNDHVSVQSTEAAAAPAAAAATGIEAGRGIARTQTARAPAGAVHLAVRAGQHRFRQSDAAKDAAGRVTFRGQR